MSLALMIASGASAALALVKQYTQQPTVAGVRIEASRFEMAINSDVSQQVLIDLDQGKHFVNDNVAPGPRIWTIEGYVGGLPAEVSSLFMPSLRIMAKVLEDAAQARQTVPMRDPDYRSFDVVISYLWVSKVPDVNNRVSVKLTVQELFMLSTTVGGGLAISAASPVPGSADGVPLGSGVTQSQAASTDDFDAAIAFLSPGGL